MNKFFMARKYIHRNERMFRCLVLINVINSRHTLESADKFKESGKDYRVSIIRSVCPYTRRKILEDQEVGQYGPDRYQVHLFHYVYWEEFHQGNKC